MELRLIEPAQFANKSTIIDAGKLRTALRQALGALIWLQQTRPYIRWDITTLATHAAEACKDPIKALGTIAVYNKTAKYFKNFRREITYSTNAVGGHFIRPTMGKLQQLRLIVFTDAGFCANRQSLSRRIYGRLVRSFGARRRYQASRIIHRPSTC